MSFPEHMGGRRVRARAVGALMLAVLLLLVLRLVQLQIIRGDDYAWQARENMVRRDPIPALRGRIFDREGRLLAGNRISLGVSLEAGHPAYADSALVRSAATIVAQRLGRDADEIARRVRRNRNRFEPVVLARDLSPERLAPLVERLEPIPGLTVAEAPIRFYPLGDRAAHLLGYVGEITEEELRDPDLAELYCRGAALGRSGIERQYESLLRGSEGITFISVDALGRKTDLFPERPPRPAVAGADLHLFLDAELQRIAERALRGAAPPAGGRVGNVRGAVVALNPGSGEVWACASTPGFDPNHFARGLSQSAWKALNQPDHPLLDRAIQAGYPPASIFKVVTTLAGIAHGIVTPQTRLDPCSGYYMFGDRAFGCWKESGHGRLALRGAFEQSCDVYYYQIGRMLGIRRLLEYTALLDLDAPTGIDLPQERSGLMPDMAWYRQHLGHHPPEGIALNLAIGQGEIVLTPIEIATFISAAVTDGRLRRPRVAAYARSPEGEVVWFAAEAEIVREIPITAEQIRLVRDLLEAAVEGADATGHRARVAGFAIGGKTGTSQNPHGEDHALFVGVAPIDDPRLVVVVVVEASGHGSTVAAPVAQAVMEAFLLPIVGPLAAGDASASPAGRSAGRVAGEG